MYKNKNFISLPPIYIRPIWTSKIHVHYIENISVHYIENISVHYIENISVA